MVLGVWGVVEIGGGWCVLMVWGGHDGYELCIHFSRCWGELCVTHGLVHWLWHVGLLKSSMALSQIFYFKGCAMLNLRTIIVKCISKSSCQACGC